MRIQNTGQLLIIVAAASRHTIDHFVFLKLLVRISDA